MLLRIGLAVLAAVVVGEPWAIASGGDPLRNFRIACYLLGALLLTLGATGSNANYQRRRLDLERRIGDSRFAGLAARPGDPTLSPGAVFVVSALALFAIGFAV